MGRTMDGKCPCGYECKTTLGASRSEFLDKDSFPFHCEDCKEIVTLNAKLLPSVTCLKCGGTNARPLTDPDMSEFRVHSDFSAVSNIRSPPFIKFDEYVEMWHSGFEEFSSAELEERGLLMSDAELKEWYDLQCRGTEEQLEKPCWGIHRGGYKCPKCSEFSLRFEEGILFD